MSFHTKRLLRKLTTCKFSEAQAEVARGQIADIVAFHVASFSPTKDIDEQMKAVAFDCYVQGLLDGAQVAPLVKSMSNEGGPLAVTELPGGGVVSTVKNADR